MVMLEKDGRDEVVERAEARRAVAVSGEWREEDEEDMMEESEEGARGEDECGKAGEEGPAGMGIVLLLAGLADEGERWLE